MSFWSTSILCFYYLGILIKILFSFIWQSHIPILLKNAVNGKELMKSLSLTALANIALDPASHKMIVKNVSHILFMAKNGTTVVQLQALRLLVNLSCNRDVVPSLLMSEVSTIVTENLTL